MVNIIHQLTLLQILFKVSGNCSNPTGSIDWGGVGKFCPGRRIILYVSFSCAWYYPPTMRLLFAKHPTVLFLSFSCRNVHSSRNLLSPRCSFCEPPKSTLREEESVQSSVTTQFQVLHWWPILTNDSTGWYWPTVAIVFPNFCLKLESSLQCHVFKDVRYVV